MYLRLRWILLQCIAIVFIFLSGTVDLAIADVVVRNADIAVTTYEAGLLALAETGVLIRLIPTVANAVADLGWVGHSENIGVVELNSCPRSFLITNDLLEIRVARALVRFIRQVAAIVPPIAELALVHALVISAPELRR